MKTIRLWLLNMRAARLVEQVAHGEVLLMETRARLQQAYGELRRTRSRIAELTPAHRLLKDALRRRDAEIRRISTWREQPATPLASRQH